MESRPFIRKNLAKEDLLNKLSYLQRFKWFLWESIGKYYLDTADKFDEALKEMPEELQTETSEFQAEELDFIKTELKNASLNSIVVMLYATFESGFNTYCENVFADLNDNSKNDGVEPSQIKIKEMPGKGIDKAKKYLKKINGPNLHCDRKPWQQVNALKDIRNAIVHNEGRIERDKITGVLKSLGKDRKIELKQIGESDFFQVTVTDQYINHAIDNLETFVREIG